jgi:HlyD family secretion protein
MSGDTVAPGSAAFRVDDMNAYYIDLLVSETDIAKIQADQPVTFSFDAIPNKTYNGIVTSVGQVGTTVSGTVNFTVTAQIKDADASVKPGMTASGNIVIASLNDVLVVPSRAIRTVNNRQVIYMLSSTPITQVTNVPATGGFTGTGTGTGTGGTQRTRTAGTGTGGTGTGAGGTFTGTGGTGAPAGFAGNFARTTLNPIATNNGESLIPITVQVGIASDTFTQIITTRLKVGDLIVVNMPTSAINTVGGLFAGGGGPGGGAVPAGGGGGGGGGFRGGG